VNWPIRVDHHIDYLLQIERREGSHTLSPLDRTELYVLSERSIAHATSSQISALTNSIVRIHENDLAAMGVRSHLYEWDFADRRLLRMICAAVLAGRPSDIAMLKATHDLPDRHGTWDDAHWNIVFRALVEDQ
jgi:lactam utilization protein B